MLNYNATNMNLQIYLNTDFHSFQNTSILFKAVINNANIGITWNNEN